MICYIVLQKIIESGFRWNPVKRTHGKVIVFPKVNGELFFEVVEWVERMSCVKILIILAGWALNFAVVTRCERSDQLMHDLSLFERALKERKIMHKLIWPFTPRHNGKVERSPRKDNEYFYATHTFYSFNDFKKQLAVHLRKYNNFPMRPLNWISPKAALDNFLKHNVTYHWQTDIFRFIFVRNRRGSFTASFPVKFLPSISEKLLTKPRRTNII